MNDNKWKSTKQIADDTGFDYQRIRKAIIDLDLPNRKKGHEYVYTNEEVEKIIESIGDIPNINKNENAGNFDDNEKIRNKKGENLNNPNNLDFLLTQRYIETLEKQLETKDEQIKSLEITIHRNEEMINNLQNQLKIGQKADEKVIDINENEIKNDNEAPPQEESKKKFIPPWRRHRKKQ